MCSFGNPFFGCIRDNDERSGRQVPLADEAVAVRVAELVDGVIKQLLSVWDRLEPATFGCGMLDVSSSATCTNDGEITFK